MPFVTDELVPGAVDVALDPREREVVRREALHDEVEDLAEDVDRLQHGADGGAERAVGQERLDELLRRDRTGSSVSGSVPVM